MRANFLRIIEAKRDGRQLAQDDIAAFVQAYTQGDVPDYQMAAFAMAVFLNGMTPGETAALTDAMLHSGDVFEWPEDGRTVDKHSTGGIGDKVSLVLAPMLASCGLRVPMISGRGLGPTGGTLDKLEAISGFRTNLSIEETQRVVEEVACVITGASERIAPADRKLYSLRDVTATVPSIPLITASIMSKKLAEGLDSLVLDVKCGSGAFMKTVEQAKELAQSLCDTGNRLNVNTTAVITDMNQPLGRMIGNAVEVDESIDALSGNGPDDLMEVTLALGVQLLLSTQIAETSPEAEKKLRETIGSGQAMETFHKMVHAQQGDLSVQRERGSITELTATKSGYVASLDNSQLGWAVIELGGGRKQLTDSIDHSVGLEILVRVGDQVESGQPWIRIYGSADQSKTDAVLHLLQSCLTIEEHPVEPLNSIIMGPLD